MNRRKNGAAMFRRIEDLPLAGKRVLVRVDFNVPMDRGEVTDDTRLRAALPTIAALRDRGAKVILCAHFGRPKGERVPDMSLAPVVGPLSRLIDAPVRFAEDCVGARASGAVNALADGEVLLLENTRFHAGEEANDPEFAAALAANADAFVNDAFSAAHRAHASTVGVAQLLPSCAGKAMERELDHLGQALSSPARPVVAVVGGAKVSTKIDVLTNLVKKADVVAVGGGMANTFVAAHGMEIGNSLCERDYLQTAREIEIAAEAAGHRVLLPLDGVVASKFEAHAPHRVKPIDQIGDDDMILDIGPASVDALADVIAEAKTVVWNGPLGAFELPPFDTATVEAAKFAAQRTRAGELVSVAGGGDTVAALNHAGVTDDFTFVSTAGGAFLEWLEGRALPGVEVLKTTQVSA